MYEIKNMDKGEKRWSKTGFFQNLNHHQNLVVFINVRRLDDGRLVF